jgi:hypothetical protein
MAVATTELGHPMALLTVAQLREHVETSLPDAALERILASAGQAIATWAGPLESLCSPASLSSSSSRA